MGEIKKKKTYSSVYPKWPNSWIHNTSFKSLLLTLIFQCGINPLFFLLRILNIFNTHTGREEKIFLKKLTVVYIQKGLTFGYTAQTLNLFNLHSFSNVGLTHYFFFFFFFLRILNIFNTHTGRIFFKETYNGIYSK